MKKIIVLLVVVMLMLVGCSKDNAGNGNSNLSDDEGKGTPKNILVKINDTNVTLEMFQKYYKMQSYDFEKEYGEQVWNVEQDGKTMTEIRQDQTIDYLVRVTLIENYIIDKGIVVEEQIINDAYNKYMDSIQNDVEIHAYFKANNLDEQFLKRFLKDQYYLRLYQESLLSDISSNEEILKTLFDDKIIRYKTRHILVEDKAVLEEALALLNDEENPADFSDLANIYSIHSTSAVRGGDLGYILIGNMPKAYEDVALSIELYTVSEIVQTEFGYHLIFVDDRQMLSDMIESGMPEDEIESYKTQIIKTFAEEEMVSVFEKMKEEATIVTNKNLLLAE